MHSQGLNMELANHGLILLQQLNAQREFGFLCDCTVAIGDVYFKAHKAVLASFSNYFKMLFIHQTSDCVRLKPTDIQPDIFSYLLHLMYTGKMAPQIIDPVRLEQGIKFLHAYPLVQEASLASHGAVPRPDQVFAWTSSLYGIQIADNQTTSQSRLSAAEKSCREPRSHVHPSRMEQERGSEANQQHPQGAQILQPSQHIGQTSAATSGTQQGLTSATGPPAAEERCENIPVLDGQPGIHAIAHVKPSIMKRNSGFPKFYVCHLCGRRFTLRSSLREHLQLHTGMSLPVANPAGMNMLGQLVEPGKPTKDSEEIPEAEVISDGELQQKNDSPMADGQLQAETPPPSDIADIDNIELGDQDREVKRRKYECSICGRKFIQKSHWREHMYIHTGKPYKCSTCDKTFCRANQAARHVCLNQNSDTYMMVDNKQAMLTEGSSEETSQSLMDPVYLATSQSNQSYKCNLCDKSFSTASEAVRHSCQNQNSDTFVLMEGQPAVQGEGSSEACEVTEVSQSLSETVHNMEDGQAVLVE
ncbi:zinc finger and BTB domain-containing protein 2-like isoform X1 [Stegostoma tigrinum]|uniref:zinc finger and BTB domain-containing protein 2-like isoform X1 n=2 Tax=Stegostoma tigrinum TaxID=3053191 RepID=UPI00202B52E5|nr:zinc finger and BTB domain-containing protein 2-like isoform X1 [Stegostoma tigrinum]